MIAQDFTKVAGLEQIESAVKTSQDTALKLFKAGKDTAQKLYKAGSDAALKGFEKSTAFTREQVGTRYVLLLVRTFVDPDDAADLAKVHALQDAIVVTQARRGSFEVADWDQASLDRMRAALNSVAAATGGINSARMFGRLDGSWKSPQATPVG